MLGLIAVACGDDDGTPLFTSTTTNASKSTTTTIGGDLIPAKWSRHAWMGAARTVAKTCVAAPSISISCRLSLEEFLDYTANTEDIATDPLALEIIDFCLRTLARTPTRPSPGGTSHRSSLSTRSPTPLLPISTCIGWRCRTFGDSRTNLRS